MWERGGGVRSTIRSLGNGRVTYTGPGFLFDRFIGSGWILVCSVSKIVSRFRLHHDRDAEAVIGREGLSGGRHGAKTGEAPHSPLWSSRGLS